MPEAPISINPLRKFSPRYGLKSLPFPRPARLKPGEPWRVAVKVIDPRGNEGLRVLTVEN